MIKAIFACDTQGGIGKDGSIPWPANKTDLKHFQTMTTGNIIVMGSKTWIDPCFPGPLKNRENYVISKTKHFEGATMLGTNFKSAIIELDRTSDKDVWIIGGAEVIKQCFDIIEEFDVSFIDGDFKCDTFLHVPTDFYFVGEVLTKDDNGKTVNTFVTYRKEP